MITGSSQGLGKALALVFSKNNYNIILHGKSKDRLEETKKEILKNDVECEYVEGDLKYGETIEKLAERAIEKDIFVLINNAAVGKIKDFADFDEKDILEELDVDLVAPIRLTKRIYGMMINKKEGIIININGMDGIRVSGNGGSAYSAAKFGLKGFTDALRFESKKYGIRVIGAYLAGMKTEMYSRNRGDNSNCMEPLEVAGVVHDICKNYPSLQVDEINIGRIKF